MGTLLKDLLEVLHVSLELNTPNEIKDAVEQIIIAQSLSPGERDTLRACFENGPLDDGDVPSKAGRNKLLDLNLVEKVVVKGEDGYNACTHQGAWSYRLIMAGA